MSLIALSVLKIQEDCISLTCSRAEVKGALLALRLPQSPFSLPLQALLQHYQLNAAEALM